MNKHMLIGLAVGLTIGGGTVFGLNALAGGDRQPQQNQVQSTSTADHNAQATAKLQNLRGDDFDKAFLAEMIQHHQGAIDMARLIESNARHDELKKLGQEIMTAQSREIDMMQSWQTDWGYKDTPKSHEAH